jgi:hypothetical protein
MLKQDVNVALHHFLRLCVPLALSSSIWGAENALAAPKPNARSWLAHKTLKSSPPSTSSGQRPTPLPERERGARTPKSALVPLLPLWEKGLGDEGDLFWQPTSARSFAITHAVVQLQGLDVPIPRVKGTATVPLKLLEKSQVYTTSIMANSPSPF